MRKERSGREKRKVSGRERRKGSEEEEEWEGGEEARKDETRMVSGIPRNKPDQYTTNQRATFINSTGSIIIQADY